MGPEVVADVEETHGKQGIPESGTVLWRTCVREGKFISKCIQTILDANLCFCTE